jgi:hypothetical protein
VELASRPGGGSLTATLFPDRWELLRTSRVSDGIALDPRHRVRVPSGVRHQLGLDAGVVVSLAVEKTRLVVWPASRLDALLAES